MPLNLIALKGQFKIRNFKSDFPGARLANDVIVFSSSSWKYFYFLRCYETHFFIRKPFRKPLHYFAEFEAIVSVVLVPDICIRNQNKEDITRL